MKNEKNQIKSLKILSYLKENYNKCNINYSKEILYILRDMLKRIERTLVLGKINYCLTSH